MTWEVTTEPAEEPVTLQEAKDWLKVDSSADDDLITALITAARIHAEKYTGRVLISQTIEEHFDCFPASGVLYLGFQPTAVTAVTYLNTDGASQTVTASDYTADLISRPSRIAINPDKAWPTTGDYPNAVTVEYEAGFADAASVPESFKVAMKLLIGFLYENREDMPLSGVNDPRVRSFHYILFHEKVLN